MYRTSGVMSGGLSDLLTKSSQLMESGGDRLQERVSRRRAIHDELQQLYRLQVRRRQPTSHIAVIVDGQKKQLAEATKQRDAEVSMSMSIHIASHSNALGALSTAKTDAS